MGELNMCRQMGTVPNFSDVARRHGMDRHTVAKYWREGCDVEDARRDKESSFDQFRGEIEERAALPGSRKKSVHEWLLHRHPGAAIAKYSAFTEYTRKENILFGAAAAAEPHPRYETPPGVQLQYDWKEDLKLHDRDGVLYEFNVFSATLGCSRVHRFRYSRTRTEDDTLACLASVFRANGGVTEYCDTDNMSGIVSLSSGRRKVSARALEFAAAAGTQLRFCRRGTPQTKGKVESSNRFVERLRVYEGDFSGEEELIGIIAHIEARSNAEPNEETGVPPAALFMKEKDFLRPVGNWELLESMVADVSFQDVPDTLLVRCRGREWSVPARCIGRRVKVMATPGGQVRVEMAGEPVAVHDLSDPRRIVYDQSHYEEAIAGKAFFAGDDIEAAALANLEMLGRLGDAPWEM